MQLLSVVVSISKFKIWVDGEMILMNLPKG